MFLDQGEFLNSALVVVVVAVLKVSVLPSRVEVGTERIRVGTPVGVGGRNVSSTFDPLECC